MPMAGKTNGATTEPPGASAQPPHALLVRQATSLPDPWKFGWASASLLGPSGESCTGGPRDCQFKSTPGCPGLFFTK